MQLLSEDQFCWYVFFCVYIGFGGQLTCVLYTLFFCCSETLPVVVTSLSLSC